MIGLSELRAIAMTLPEVEEGPPVQAARESQPLRLRERASLAWKREV